ncbi:hypothetical protein KHQ82_04635 [Mycoplasmatota bacterium]|nr:hypothetical protein KHQ82_04635 [Mycoplasmatota bacterium]
MKKLLIVFTLLFTLLPVVSAEDGDVNAGMTPDSPFYFLDKLIEDLDLALTFDEVSKTEKFIAYAKERLAEAEEMNEEEKQEFIEELLLEYTDGLEKASDNLLNLEEEDANELEGDLDDAICESDELSDQIDPELAAKLEEKKGQAYVKFTVLREALTEDNQESIVNKANESGFGLGELSKIAIGAELLGMSLEEVLDAVIEAGNLEDYFTSQDISMNELVTKGLDKKQNKLQERLAYAVGESNEKAISRIENQLQNSIEREEKDAIIHSYKNGKEEILNDLGVEDLDELSDEEKTQVKEELNTLKTEKKEELKTFINEKKEEVKNTIKEVNETKDAGEKSKGLEKLQEKMNKKPDVEKDSNGKSGKGNK